MALGDPTDVIVAILERRVGYLRVESGTFRSFARNYMEYQKQYERQLAALSIFSLPLRFLSPYGWLSQRHALRRLEDNVVSTYLLSTDFFHNGADEKGAVTYLSFYDPLVVICRNPFNRQP